MLQPSWTWQALASRHFEGDALRAAENGFTMLRCSSDGESGVVDNTGRILAAPVLIWLSAWMKATLDLRLAVTCLGGFFLAGLLFLAFLPETHGQDLPD